MHADDPFYIDDEPSRTNPNTLSNCKAPAMRMRASILGHNEILWDADGDMTKQEMETNDSIFKNTLTASGALNGKGSHLFVLCMSVFVMNLTHYHRPARYHRHISPSPQSGTF